MGGCISPFGRNAILITDNPFTPMITINHYPKNKDRFIKLIEFCKEVLDICSSLDISPVLNGSLAIFAYTKNQDMNVDDVDLACSETDFPKIISALEERRISYRLKEWHVLQILRDGLKVDLDSLEYWYKDLPMDFETLQIENYEISILGLDSLKEFYRRGMEDRANKTDQDEKIKYEALKVKYEALCRVKD
jgi:hypothetical protein